jgi:hypothetical protein
MKDINDIYLYRMTHIENIPHILQYGITHKASPNANPSYKEIGDSSLIATRAARQLAVNNGNINQEAATITLGDYIPFYFGIRMPMLYVIQHGFNFAPEPTSPTDIIYLVLHLLTAIEEQTSPYYYTDGHPTDNLTAIYDNDNIAELPARIDWNSITASFWGGENQLDTKRKKQAEFLMKDDIPAGLIHAFMCHDEEAKERLVQMGISEQKIKIYSNAYYD